MCVCVKAVRHMEISMNSLYFGCRCRLTSQPSPALNFCSFLPPSPGLLLSPSPPFLLLQAFRVQSTLPHTPSLSQLSARDI